MREGAPSATAQGAALHRAVHQLIDHPRVLDDPWALPIVGPEALADLQATVDRQSRGMRAGIVLRSRYAEDRLAAAFERGVRQYVVLGAGLDTFAYRNPHAGLRVYEVDHPATQAWKQARLAAAPIPVPDSAAWVPVDFEVQSLADRLYVSGLDRDRPVFFSLLGVATYLTRPALFSTLEFVRSCAAGSEIVFSFSLPESMLSEAQRARRTRSMAAMAALGEPWVSFYQPAVLAANLRAAGFRTAQVLAPGDANRLYFGGRSDGLRIGSNHMMAAVV
ncbi:MAG: class I SAM-dependent methyltransferase [Burkholderiales bacterium]|nr:class I SAM-dependent methyltransferase [Burkholderiales bacterium]